MQKIKNPKKFNINFAKKKISKLKIKDLNNKNLLSKYLAIDIAENLLRLIPKRTHDFNLFLSPSKLQSISQKYNLNLMDIEGMQYNPIFKSFKLSRFDLVNYFGTLKY